MKTSNIAWLGVLVAGSLFAQLGPASQSIPGKVRTKLHAAVDARENAAKPALDTPQAATSETATSRSASRVSGVNNASIRRPSPEVLTKPVSLARETDRRDPFVSPIVRAQTGKGSPCTAAGKKCLAPDQVVLRGIVQAPQGMIAVVESTSRRISYFLRENDPVFNGYVVKITEDSIVFRENTSDTLGHTGTRDITKRVTAPAV